MRNRAELVAALAAVQAAGCDSLLCFTDPVTLANRDLIAAHARQMRVPAVYPRRDYVEAGGLVSYGPNMEALYLRLAYFVERIASGTRAGDLPVEMPTVIETIVNRRAADAIELAIPPNVLARADAVIG